MATKFCVSRLNPEIQILARENRCPAYHTYIMG
jgi:hypothetical protein